VVSKLGIDVHLLGAFEVTSDERIVEIGSVKQRALLAILVVNRNRAVSLDALAEELWGEKLPSSVSVSVQSLVSRLRRHLATAGGNDARLRASGAGYVLELDASMVDACRFEDLAARAREASVDDPRAAVPLFRQALSLWRGPALADLADFDFARAEATRLEEARSEVVEELVDAELILGHPGAALALLESQVAAHPLRERGWGQLMLCLYRLGRQAEAVRAYQDLRRLLGEELGLEPTPALRQLEQQILRQSPELDGPLAPPRTALDDTGSPAPPIPVRSPAGTLVFVFTDIEASTRRWEGDQEAMAWDLARHDELLREAVERHQGRLFTHTGDGLGASFPTVSDALAAAVAGQRALLDQAWKALAPLRVRMAIHVGTAEAREGTYLGPTLHRTARLLDLAAGGQILCSQAAFDLARDERPPEVTLLDLGEHSLADLSRPERVYQVHYPDLPSAFPPLHSPGSPRHNLPLALTPFVGRERELEELTKLLPSTRLLTLTGVGGAGKTRLALELATRCRARFPDGAWLVDLAPQRDASLVASEVLAALGVLTGGGSTDPEERVCEYLSSRCLLLIVDNCEHLVDGVARLVRRILTRCAHVKVLATSREVLGLPGESPWPVPCLSLPPPRAASPSDLEASDAAALFCSRARVAHRGFGVTEANAATVAQICRRLDGIPLALELAAARVRAMGAQQLAARLDDRFRLLTAGGRTTVPRHQTLRATMDWSFDLLSAGEQALWRRLAVFPQSFGLDAAEGVASEEAAAAGWEVLDLLAHLVDKSLVSVQDEGQNGETRYRLLETVRQYGAEKLAEAGETQAAHRRHRDFFLGLAGHGERSSLLWWKGPWIRRLDADLDNFHAALDWSLAESDHEAALNLCACLGTYWVWAERIDSGFDRLRRALDGSAGVSTALRTEALLGLAWARMGSRDRDVHQAEAAVREALSITETAGDPYAAARAKFTAGQLLPATGLDREATQRLFAEALTLYEERGAVLEAALCHHELGWIAMAAGQPAEAGAHFDRGLELNRRGGSDELLLPHLLADAAVVAALTGESERAEFLANEAIGAARSVPVRGILVMALVRGAQAAVLSGRYRPRPAVLLRELLGLLQELGAHRWVAEALEAAVLVLEAAGRVEAASRVLCACDSLRYTLGDSTALPALAASLSACRERLAERLGPESSSESRGWRPSREDLLLLAAAELRDLESIH